MDIGGTLRTAREQAGLTQAALARRAAVSQPNVSAYEAGDVAPSTVTLERLLRAAGCSPVFDVEPAVPCDLSGPIGARVRAHRAAIRKLLGQHQVRRVFVFGSVARGEEGPDSDLDLLVEMRRPSLVRLAALRRQLSELLGVPVDVTTSSMLRPQVRATVTTEAVPL